MKHESAADDWLGQQRGAWKACLIGLGEGGLLFFLGVIFVGPIKRRTRGWNSRVKTQACSWRIAIGQRRGGWKSCLFSLGEGGLLHFFGVFLLGLGNGEHESVIHESGTRECFPSG